MKRWLDMSAGMIDYIQDFEEQAARECLLGFITGQAFLLVYCVGRGEQECIDAQEFKVRGDGRDARWSCSRTAAPCVSRQA